MEGFDIKRLDDIARQTKRALVLSASLGLSALLLAGCQSLSSPGQLIVGVPILVMEKTIKASTSGECRDLKMRGQQLGEHEGLPCYDNNRDLSFSYNYDVPSLAGKDYLENVTWRRGDFSQTLKARVGRGAKARFFPLAPMRAQLGENVAGIWSVELEVDGKTRGSLSFRVVDEKLREHYTQLALECEAKGNAPLADRMWKRSFECNPLSPFWQTRKPQSMIPERNDSQTTQSTPDASGLAAARVDQESDPPKPEPSPPPVVQNTEPPPSRTNPKRPPHNPQNNSPSGPWG